MSAPLGVFSPGAPASSDTDTGFERGNYIFVFKVISPRRKIPSDALDAVWERKDLQNEKTILYHFLLLYSTTTIKNVI